MAQSPGVQLTQIYPSTAIDTQTVIDIIAVHGMDTKSPDTWVWKSQVPNEPSVNWLSDSKMLPSKVGAARIFTCDWPARMLQQADSLPKVLKEFARLLLDAIQNMGRPPASDSQTRGRPILFITSCLGGIILMEALLIADDPTSPYYPLRRATRGIVFLSTPFQGTSFQDVANWAVPTLRIWASLSKQNVTTLLDSVREPTFDLSERVSRFTRLSLNSEQPCDVFTFYETGAMNLVRSWIRRLPRPLPCLLHFMVVLSRHKKPLVDRITGTLQIVPDPLPLDVPHKLTNKFCSNEDPNYKLVRGKVEEFLQRARGNALLDEADLWIRGKSYTTDRLNIKRLSGELLSMDRCYINLAVIERSSENESCQDAGEFIQSFSPPSSHIRLRNDTANQKNHVELPALFQAREKGQRRMEAPQRILIRGRAGVGKTTLSKKIVYDFIHHGPWKALFDRILWVPLRHLKMLPNETCNLEELFLREYFSQNPKARDLAHALWAALFDNNYRRTLFVLDGLDEVSEGLDASNNMFYLLETLLGTPHVIVTSRPYGPLPYWLKPRFDLELEAIGFYPDQVKAYADMAFSLDETRLKDFRSFLRDHWLIDGLVRIPIVLDALCFTWDNACSHGTKPETMTALYREIELRLFQKDICRLRHKTEYECQTMNRQHVEEIMEKEIRLLEALAFSGVCNDVLDFDQRQRHKIYNSFHLSVTESSIEGLSFLRTSDPSSKNYNRNYHFLHATFQEYFAARYFVRQWKNDERLQYLTLDARGSEHANFPTPVEFLRQHKYITSYDIIWRFVAGLLDDDRTGGADDFFSTVEREQPQGPISHLHYRLTVHCLSEVSSDILSRRRLEENVSKWLLRQCNAAKNARLVREMEFPERLLNSALQKANNSESEIILRSIKRRPSIPVSTIELVAPWLKDDIPSQLRVCICDMLQRSGEDFQDGLQDVPKHLDKDWDAREAAVEPHRRQSNLSDDILKDVAAQLGHQDSDVRRSATCVLDYQSSLSDNVLQTVVDLLDHEDRHAQEAAVDVLTKQTRLSDDILKGVAAKLDHQDFEVREAAKRVHCSRYSLTQN